MPTKYVQLEAETAGVVYPLLEWFRLEKTGYRQRNNQRLKSILSGPKKLDGLIERHSKSMSFWNNKRVSTFLIFPNSKRQPEAAAKKEKTFHTIIILIFSRREKYKVTQLWQNMLFNAELKSMIAANISIKFESFYYFTFLRRRTFSRQSLIWEVFN